MLIFRHHDFATTPDERLYTLRAATMIENWLRSAPGAPQPAPFTKRCPECGFEDSGNGLHGAYDGFIILGCEGYWVINPNLLGFDRPLWTNENGECE